MVQKLYSFMDRIPFICYPFVKHKIAYCKVLNPKLYIERTDLNMYRLLDSK